MFPADARFFIWPKYMVERNGQRIVFDSGQRSGPGEIMARLFAARGGLVSREEIVDALHGHDESGGPLGALECNRVTIFRLRQRLKTLGIKIVTEHGRGYRVEVM